MNARGDDGTLRAVANVPHTASALIASRSRAVSVSDLAIIAESLYLANLLLVRRGIIMHELRAPALVEAVTPDPLGLPALTRTLRALADPARSMLGPAQEQWLDQGLALDARTRARFHGPSRWSRRAHPSDRLPSLAAGLRATQPGTVLRLGRAA